MERQLPVRQWIDLKAHWERIEEVAEAIHAAHGRRESKTGRFWTEVENPHLPGFAGEVAFAILTGRKVRTDIREGGDDGKDFVDPDGTIIDAKTATRIDCRVSLCHDPHPRHLADIYVLTVVDLEERRGAYLGFATGGELMQAPIKSLKAGVEPRHTLREEHLDERVYWIGGPD